MTPGGGAYIVLEGGDFCGKSTQATRLVAALRARGREVEHVREPGSTPLAESLRELVLADTGREIEPVTEALLFSAARRELMTRTVAPALARGAVVVAERSFVSTMVYQCIAPVTAEERVPLETVVEMTRAVHGDVWPTAVLVLDLDPSLGGARRASRGELDRIENRGDAFAKRVRQAFLEVAASNELAGLVGPGRAHVVDASADLDAVESEIARVLAPIFEPAGEGR